MSSLGIEGSAGAVERDGDRGDLSGGAGDGVVAALGLERSAEVGELRGAECRGVRLEGVGGAAQQVGVAIAGGVGELGEQRCSVVEERRHEPPERLVVGCDRPHPFECCGIERHGSSAACRRSVGGGSEGDGEFLGADRFGEVVVHPGSDARFAVALHRVGGHRHDPDRLRPALGWGRAGPDLAGCLQAVHLGHLDVHQHEVVRESLDGLDGLDAVRGDIGAVAERFEDEQCDLLVDGVVLGQQHPQRVAFAELGDSVVEVRRHDARLVDVGEHRHEHVEQLRLLDRLGQHPGEDRIGGFGATQRRVEHERKVRSGRPESIGEFEPVHPWHVHVEHGQVVVVAGVDAGQGFGR